MATELSQPTASSVDSAATNRQAQARKAQVLNKSKTCGLSEVAIAGSIARTDPSGERAEIASHNFDLTWNKMGRLG